MAWDWNSFDYRDNVKKTKDRDKALILSIIKLLKKEKIKKTLGSKDALFIFI